MFAQVFISIVALFFSFTSPVDDVEEAATLPPRLPDLVVVKDDNVPPHGAVRSGARITYTILYTNTGVGDAHHVVLTETLPSHTRYVGFGWTHIGGDQYVNHVGTLAYGEGGVLQFVVAVERDGLSGVTRVVNRVAIAGDGGDADELDNAFREVTPLRGEAQLYVACRDSHSIDVFNLQDFAHVTSFDAGPRPFGMLIAGDRLYVANAENPAIPKEAPNTVSVVDLETHQVVQTVTVGSGPLNLTALDGYIYVTNHDFDGEGVTVIDAATESVVARLTLDRPLVYDWGFFGITHDPVRWRVYATKRFMGGEGIWRITPSGAPVSFTLDWVLDMRSGLPSSKPYAILYHGETDRVYVTFPHLDQVRAYDPDTFALLDTYQTQRQASDLADTDGGKGLVGMGPCVYNANHAARSVTVLAEGDCCAPFSGTQGGSAFRLYLPLLIRGWYWGTAGMSLRTTQATVTHIPVGGHPKGLAVGGGYVYVTLPQEDAVAVIDICTQQVIYEIQTPCSYPQQAVINVGY
jgi:uncharacterized repeat protein (TIGR01451 family)